MEWKNGTAHMAADPPRYFVENLKKLMQICTHFNNIDHFVNIFNEIEPLGDSQISMHFPKTITQNASAP